MKPKKTTSRRGDFIIRRSRHRVDIPDLGRSGKRTLSDLPIGRALQIAAFVLAAVSVCFLVSYLFYLFMLVKIGVPFSRAARFPITK